MIMKSFLTLILSFIFLSVNTTSQSTMTDPRDGQTYKIIKLKDGKVWMAENLNYEMSGSWCYSYSDNLCEKYGRLYTWKSANKACPDGWRLPSDDDWWNMISKYGLAANTYHGKLEHSGNGEAAYDALILGGDSGFSAQLAGYCFHNGNSYDQLNEYGYYWTSTNTYGINAIEYFFSFDDYQKKELSLRRYNDEKKELTRFIFANKKNGNSCRCIKD